MGPVFNALSCVTCHSLPAVGGFGDVEFTSFQFGAIINGRFNPLSELGGPVLQRFGMADLDGSVFPRDPDFVDDFLLLRGEVIPNADMVEQALGVIPDEIVVSPRRASSIFGLGLVDAVPDDAYWEISERQMKRDRETAGRPNIVVNLITGLPAVGKFGWKAQQATLFDFGGDAYKNENGITTDAIEEPEDDPTTGWFPDASGASNAMENCPQGACELLAINPGGLGPDDTDLADIVEFNDFMTFLGPPPRGQITKQAKGRQGLFQAIGCADCHVPTLRTGRHEVAALDRVKFHPYSDFLLHDIGTGDGIENGSASGAEMRTAPLWGLGELAASTGFLLHDGRATTIEEAIMMHDVQANKSREKFERLKSKQREMVLAFLRSL